MPTASPRRVVALGLAGTAGAALLLTLSTAPASGLMLKPPPPWLAQAQGVDPDEFSAAVPKCLRRPPERIGPNEPVKDVVRSIRREARCQVRLALSLAGLFRPFLDAVDEGNGQTACRLLTDHERARLGRGALCHSQFEAIAGRTRIEREPFPDALAFQRRFLRGELGFRLVRPLEAIRLRFEAESGRWRIANTRDLFHQHLPVPPPEAEPQP